MEFWSVSSANFFQENKGMFGYLRWLELEVNAMKAPDGSRAYPGKTCRDIRMCLPDVTSGTYLAFCLD